MLSKKFQNHVLGVLPKQLYLLWLCLGFVLLSSSCLSPGVRLPPPFFLMPQEVKIKVGESVTLTPSYSMSMITTWISQDQHIATVTNGIVTGLATGFVTVRAYIGSDSSAPTTITVSLK